MGLYSKFRANWPKYINHIKFYFSSFFSRLQFVFQKKSQFWSGQPKIKKLLFITEDPRIDIVKYFKALKRHYPKLHVRLMTSHSKLDKLLENSGFEEVLYFNNHWDFRIKLNALAEIDIIHGFTRRCYITEIVKKEYNVPLVISVKDTSVSSHGLNPPHWYLRKELPSEKYSLEHVDGVLAESLEVCHASRLFQLNSKPKRIYFPNYCEDASIIESPTKINDDNLHLVYVGSIRGSQDSKEEHGNIQMHWLINALNEQKIHFHIYPNPNMNRATYEEYFNMDEQLEFFHMHESLPPEKMNLEISKYHFGIIPFFNEDTQRSPFKRYYSSSLKIFNYVESGLPVLISKDMGHQRWVLERYGLALEMSKQEFFQVKTRLEGIDYKYLLSNLKSSRPKITLGNQIHRAVKFYNEVITEFYERESKGIKSPTN